MRLLILGGTGFIGPYQVRYALARGHHVTIFNRGRQKEAWPGPVAELIGDGRGDLKAPEGGDWDVCIDNPTSLPAWVRDAASVLKRWRRKPDSNFSSLSRQFLRAGGAVRGNQMAGQRRVFRAGTVTSNPPPSSGESDELPPEQGRAIHRLDKRASG